MFYVYIIQSEVTGKFYVGQTKDVNKRVLYHNSNSSKYTGKFKPWKLVKVEGFETRSEAVKREREIKSSKNISRFLEVESSR
ncbi:MAG: GIY-YIG nuclease family protein [Ignavibacteria bacterium]|nr:GIY-YIG nuclease family protein [Ignavibacteria bacterium]